jgi:hypothetical protein
MAILKPLAQLFGIWEVHHVLDELIHSFMESAVQLGHDAGALACTLVSHIIALSLRHLALSIQKNPRMS